MRAPFAAVFGAVYRLLLTDRAHLSDAAGIGFYAMFIGIVIVSALVHELQFLTPEMKRWVDEGLVELERFANAAEKGFTAWASASTEQGRMGSAEEFAQHFGTALGLDVAPDHRIKLMLTSGLGEVAAELIQNG